MKQADFVKRVIPLDLEGLEVLEGELLLVTGGAGFFAGAGDGCGCGCSGGKGCGCGCDCSSGGVGCGCGCS